MHAQNNDASRWLAAPAHSPVSRGDARLLSLLRGSPKCPTRKNTYISSSCRPEPKSRRYCRNRVRLMTWRKVGLLNPSECPAFPCQDSSRTPPQLSPLAADAVAPRTPDGVSARLSRTLGFALLRPATPLLRGPMSATSSPGRPSGPRPGDPAGAEAALAAWG
jgi:hypothetical protein